MTIQAVPTERFDSRDAWADRDSDAITAIICDEHPAFARGLAKLLEVETDDIEVVGIARSSEEAESLASDLQPDIVVMDLRMKGVCGIEAVRRIREASPVTKVVMLTASEDASNLCSVLRAGAVGYVIKDRDVWEIAEAVRSVNRGYMVVPAELAARFVQDLDEAEPVLSDAERVILAGLARGETNREIGVRLEMSERTVKRRLQDIYRKLHVADRLDAAIYSAKRGFGPNEKGDSKEAPFLAEGDWYMARTEGR